MARHPFSGAYSGPEDMSLERATKEYRYVYGKDAKEKRMTPPPFALGLDSVTREVRELFEQAFREKGSRGMRPQAREWVKALDALAKSVRQCRSNPCHAYLRSRRSCPFCKIESDSGSALFNLPILFKTAAGKKRTAIINIGTIWKEIRAVEAPQRLAPFERVATSMGKEKSSSSDSWAIPAGAIACLIVAFASLSNTNGFSLLLLCALPVLGWPYLRETREREDHAQRLSRLDERWKALVAPREFQKYRVQLRKAKLALDGLGEEHERNLRGLQTHKHRDQLAAYLDKQRIAGAAIKGIGKVLKVILQSYGIETARDLDHKRLSAVPCVGPARVKALTEWRKSVEKGFRFDPTKGVDPVAHASVERATQMKRARLVQLLSEGPAKLRHIAKHTHLKRKGLHAEMERVIQGRAS